MVRLLSTPEYIVWTNDMRYHCVCETPYTSLTIEAKLMSWQCVGVYIDSVPVILPEDKQMEGFDPLLLFSEEETFVCAGVDPVSCSLDSHT